MEKKAMIKNMRDLGGIKTRDGLTVRHGCLIRSGNLHNLGREFDALL